MMLSDLGADVLRVERPSSAALTGNPITERGLVQQAPAPLFSRTPVAIAPNEPGEAILARRGLG